MAEYRYSSKSQRNPVGVYVCMAGVIDLYFGVFLQR